MQKDYCKNNIMNLLFILPALTGTLFFVGIPIICSFLLSFTSWDLLNEIKFVGLENYRYIFTEKIFTQVIANTIVYAISTTFIAIIIPLILADIINKKIKGAEFFKTAFFIPFITPAVVVAIIWSRIFDPNIGFINTILGPDLKWLYDTRLAMPVLIFISAWKLIGYNVILFLTGLASLNKNIYEAANIDGANGYQTLILITLPLLKPMIFFVTLVTAITSFQAFDLVYMLTNGGPQNSTSVMVYSVYKYAFEYFDIGKSCAIAYLLFIIIFIMILFQNKIKKIISDKKQA